MDIKTSVVAILNKKNKIIGTGFVDGDAFDDASISENPGAVIPHAGFVRGRRVTGSPTATAPRCEL